MQSSEKGNNAVCTICTKAVQQNLPLLKNSSFQKTKDAYVSTRFCSWNHTIESFKNHKNNEFHWAAVSGLENLNNASVLENMLEGKKKDMRNARIALTNIIDTVLFVAKEGLPYRGKSNKSAVENV